MIEVRSEGDWSDTKRWLEGQTSSKILSILRSYGEKGVAALASATPVDSGKTASSWRYEIVGGRRGRASLVFHNDNVVKGVNIAMILQYGHGTRNGGYVQGRDYINPVIRPLFDSLANAAGKELGSK